MFSSGIGSGDALRLDVDGDGDRVRGDLLSLYEDGGKFMAYPFMPPLTDEFGILVPADRWRPSPFAEVDPFIPPLEPPPGDGLAEDGVSPVPESSRLWVELRPSRFCIAYTIYKDQYRCEFPRFNHSRDSPERVAKLALAS